MFLGGQSVSPVAAPPVSMERQILVFNGIANFLRTQFNLINQNFADKVSLF